MPLHSQFLDPPREFSLLPFWFWNDALSEDELRRQLDDFEAHGVYGFTIHPRVGLPRDTGWMSDKMLHFMRFAVEEAARRAMTVVLYDEGMYPSGSSSGQVVAENPAFACRGLAHRVLRDGEELKLAPDHNLVAVVPRRDGTRVAVFDRRVDAVIRGLHFLNEGEKSPPDEDEPPAADLLNPEAVQCFVRLVYDRYFQELEKYFGDTIIGVFTDEPGLLGRLREREKLMPGTTGILPIVNEILGYDFTPHLPALWFDDEPDAAQHRQKYFWAVHQRLEQTYYAVLSRWCEAHGVALMGHPAAPDEIGIERYFHIPGQDIVWRYIEPDEPSALEGAQSAQAKCTSSAMLHLGRRRNSNECYGAYGHELTYDETKWIADWLFVRGVNMLLPHAFYYSVRGPRRDERPPDVGPHSPWWRDYAAFALYCRRLCWLNTDSRPVCEIAILGEANHLGWRAAKVCFEHQRDFNYVEMRDLWERARVDAGGLHLAGMHYKVLIIDDVKVLPDPALASLKVLSEAGRVLCWQPQESSLVLSAREFDGEADFIAAIDELVQVDVRVTPAQPNLRYRHVQKESADWYLLFNEGAAPITFDVQLGAPGKYFCIDPLGGEANEWNGETIQLAGHQTLVLKNGETT